VYAECWQVPYPYHGCFERWINTIQYNTIQYNTIQYNKIHDMTGHVDASWFCDCITVSCIQNITRLQVKWLIVVAGRIPYNTENSFVKHVIKTVVTLKFLLVRWLKFVYVWYQITKLLLHKGVLYSKYLDKKHSQYLKCNKMAVWT
jgi:hypothetical protein